MSRRKGKPREQWMDETRRRMIKDLTENSSISSSMTATKPKLSLDKILIN